MAELKPIETQYHGYRFRSRLEARWAVFFDHLGITYEYEQQGYQLPSGARYLPDFWLPRHSIYIEVKGEEAAFLKEGRRYAEFVGTQNYECGLVILGPIPEPSRPHLSSVLRKHHDEFKRRTLCHHLINFGDLNGPYFMEFCADLASLDLTRLPLLDPYGGHLTWVHGTDSHWTHESDGWPKVSAAFVAARSARFEHGEHGRQSP